MNEKLSPPAQPESGETGATGNLSDPDNPAYRKPVFVQPSVTCHGLVVDLTALFGGSFEPSSDD